MRKIYLSIILFPFLLTACFNGKAGDRKNVEIQSLNTSFFPGKIWNDTNEKPINAHGGGVLYHEGTYYWYGDYKAGTTKSYDGQGKKYFRTDVTGISCYSSKDLINWTYNGLVLNAVQNDSLHDLHTSQVLERPKVIYNKKTRKFVMWMHIDSPDYAKARVGVAVCDSPTGEFTYLESFRPNDLVSRDQTLFVDDNGKGYHFYSSEYDNAVYISLLSDDYLKPSGKYTRVLFKQPRESPAVFKSKKKYYMLTSGCMASGSNPTEIAVADSIMGAWKILGNPCVGPNAHKAFYAQNTFVIPVHGKENAFIAMFDKWEKTNLEKSLYIWLPIVFDETKFVIPWYDNWDMTIFSK